ncbi:zona pellucida sperm-binding protein 3-like [Carassius carassius]|uniref:zona pellucida sperm-binding protein 3-like n=1 Tax=Carassius carassius TaxID=217509 RepID=UPI0028684446|nr:zona pellucida sperm-binding protein 3-like [Carassius carassius]
MISGWLLLLFVATAKAKNDLTVDCGSGDSVTVRWRPRLDSSQKLDPSRGLLGNCPPSFTMSDDMLIFYALLRDCGFLKQVTADSVTYSNMLIYDRQPELPFIFQRVQCVYDSAVSKMTAFGAVEDEKEGLVTFSMELMNSDFSAPAPSMRFQLGSVIPIRATVESPSHRQLKIYMESCVAATDANISRAAQVHPIIANVGCLMESKSGNSSFLPRRHPAEMRLYLQAFKFALGQNIFLHCDLEAWDVQCMDRKVCHYRQQQRRWELLDDPSQSYVCSCCEFSCFWRTDCTKGLSARKVLGPFVMEGESRSDTSLDTQSSAEGGLTVALLWLLVVSVTAALVTIMGVLAVSYYLCFWRGGRLGYRPIRDLLTKY